MRKKLTGACNSVKGYHKQKATIPALLWPRIQEGDVDCCLRQGPQLEFLYAGLRPNPAFKAKTKFYCIPTSIIEHHPVF
jgi:hypothetical protein